MELPAEGALTFEQKRELSYIVRFIVHADNVLADVNQKELVKEARQALGLAASGILTLAQKLRLSGAINTIVSVPARALAVERLRGAGRVAEQRALRPEHTPVQFARALRALARNEEIKITVDWGGRKTALTTTIFTEMVTYFSKTNPAILQLHCISRSKEQGSCCVPRAARSIMRYRPHYSTDHPSRSVRVAHTQTSIHGNECYGSSSSRRQITTLTVDWNSAIFS
jgi:hypothetical protein